MKKLAQWDPKQYLRFEKERKLPFLDLMNLVHPKRDMDIVDLGCGPGQLTVELHERFAASHTLGLDSSREMLERTHELKASDVVFQQADISTYAPEQPYDLVFSNAALQWVPDHEHLFARVTEWVAPGGQLAVQMPMNYDAIAHVTAAEVGERDPYNVPSLRRPVLTPEEYSRLIFDLGYSEQIVQMRIYPHVLDSTDSVVEWVKGSLLSYYRKSLSEELYQRFEEEYHAELLERAGQHEPFFYPFKRILIWAKRPD